MLVNGSDPDDAPTGLDPVTPENRWLVQLRNSIQYTKDEARPEQRDYIIYYNSSYDLTYLFSYCPLTG